MVTMVLSTVFVMAACYTSITSNFTSELKAEAQAISVAIGEKSVDDMINTICANVTDKRITLIDKDGNVLFDNVEDFSKMGNCRCGSHGYGKCCPLVDHFGYTTVLLCHKAAKR